MKKMSEADRKVLEADRVRRYKANGVSQEEAERRAKKDVSVVELNESRRSMRPDSPQEIERTRKRKEMHMRQGMTEAEADIASKVRWSY
ncbi:MAG: hypothetical protein ACRD20_18190 [Terriglobales bacterium]